MRIDSCIAKRHLILVAIAFAAACGPDSVVVPRIYRPSDDMLQLKPISDTQLSGIVGEAVEPAPTVMVSRGGNPVAGITVMFTPLGDSSGTSEVANATSITNAQGVATAGNWKLATTAGVKTLRASIPDAPDVFFVAQATPGAAAELLALPTSPFGLPGSSVAAPSVHVEDRFGNSVGSGIEVSFTVTAGGGRLARALAQTNAYGVASAGSWQLGPEPGVNTVVATALALDSVTFTVEAQDVGHLTWYDLETVDDEPLDPDPDSYYSVGCCWIALSDNGAFLQFSDYGWIGGNESSGTYEVSGSNIVLKYSGGEREQGTLLDRRLSLHRDDGYMSGLWSYVRRTGALDR